MMNHIPIDLVGCNVRITDRFHRDYELTKGEKKIALFFKYFLAVAVVIAIIV